MSKIEVEDLTAEGMSEKKKEQTIMALANGLVQSAGRSGPMLGLTFKDVALALFTAAEIILIVGEKVGKVPSEEATQIRDTAKEYADKRQEELKKSGVMDVIEAVKAVADKVRGDGDE